MKRTFTKYPQSYVKASIDYTRKVTVGELIEQLSQFDPNLEVSVFHSGGVYANQCRRPAGKDEQGNQKYWDFVGINYPESDWV